MGTTCSDEPHPELIRKQQGKSNAREARMWIRIG